MFLPLHDNAPLKIIRFQFVTVFIILLNIAIFLASGAVESDAVLGSLQGNFGLVPAQLLHQTLTPAAWPEPVTLVTYLFLHGGWMHLIGNMLFLWVFADNVEDAYGYAGFAIFYLLCGVIGGLAHVYMMPNSENPLIGASGAVSGVLAAYVVLYPRARVWILLFIPVPVPIPAFFVVGGWFALQVYSVLSAKAGADIAWWAHIGGFMAGLILTLILRSWLTFRPNGRI